MQLPRTSLSVSFSAMLTVGALVGCGPAPAGTPIPLVHDAPEISFPDIQRHLEELHTIAEDSGGNRAHGEPGHKASVDYIEEQLDEAGFDTTLHEFTTHGGIGWNLTADWPVEETDEVLMVGGHIDSSPEGPGINDNGSGSAALLATARTLADEGFEPSTGIRFAWWGGEELGLIGSTHYVQNLPEGEQENITGYLNFDMIASPNAGYFTYSSSGQPEGSAELQKPLNDYFDSVDVPTEDVDIGGRSDHTAFADAGIPTAGTFSGADGTKTADQADKWGGTVGEPFDACYHRACDTIDNIDAEALDHHADAIAYATWSHAG